MGKYHYVIMVTYGTFQGKIPQNTAYYNDAVTTSIHTPHQVTCMHPNHLVFKRMKRRSNQQYNTKYNYNIHTSPYMYKKIAIHYTRLNY